MVRSTSTSHPATRSTPPLSRARASASNDGGRLWSIVLAGGEGKRLRPLIERIHPDGRPKQFAVLLGSRSLLRHTLDRVELAIPRERTVVVATRSQEPFLATEFASAPAPEVLVQPLDRGTAAGILLPVQWIAGQNPAATVAVFPSDHFIADDAAFMRHVLRLAGLAARDLERIFLVGARPDSAETGYGWIEPGARLGPPGVRRVVRFWEKPSAQMARVCLTRGCLWNTFVMVGRAEAFLRAARESMPSLAGALEPIRPVAEPLARARSLDRAYARVPTAGFSDAVLAALPERLAVSALPASTWSDWGTPERVLHTLRSRGITPDWLQRLATTA